MTTSQAPAKRRRAARPQAAKPRPEPGAADRQLLRAVARLAARADPEQLAGLVTEIDATLKSCVAIQEFFTAYVAALRARVVH